EGAEAKLAAVVEDYREYAAGDGNTGVRIDPSKLHAGIGVVPERKRKIADGIHRPAGPFELALVSEARIDEWPRAGGRGGQPDGLGGGGGGQHHGQADEHRDEGA